MRNHLLSAFVFLAAPALAQTAPGLIGLTRNLPLVLNINTGTCLAQRCIPAIPSASTLPPWAGGTAYDSVRGGTWITNGNVIAEVGQGTCATFCPAQPVPISPNAVATGLAYNESTKTLFISDSLNFISTVQVTGCNLTVTSTCQTWPVSTTNPTIGGLATDDVNGLIFYSGSSWTASTPNNTIFVARQTTPCNYFCKLLVPNCGGVVLGPITGLAHDCCRNVLWATDGINWTAISYNLTNCTATALSCCKLPFTTEPLIGLCTLPSIATSTDQTAASKSCTNPSCATCPTMEHTMIGQPTLGTPGFTLRLDNAPAGATGYLLLNAGACTAGVPFGCGQIFVPLAGWVVIGPFGTGGGVGCTGGNAFTLSLAPNPSYCGLTFSTQYAVLCLAGTPIGTALSNCLSWMISSS